MRVWAGGFSGDKETAPPSDDSLRMRCLKSRGPEVRFEEISLKRCREKKRLRALFFQPSRVS